jgi:hypothetical protein
MIKRFAVLCILMLFLLPHPSSSSGGRVIEIKLPAGSILEMDLYLVAGVNSSDIAEYTLTGGFELSGADLNIDTAAKNQLQANLLLDYALKNSISPTGSRHSSDGNPLLFSGLDPGIYLLAQNSSGGQSHDVLGPFLIRTPHGDAWTVTSNIESKVVPATTPGTVSTPSSSPSPRPGTSPPPGDGEYTPPRTEVDDPDDPLVEITPRPSPSPPPTDGEVPPRDSGLTDEPRLPQTGLPRWPVPLLSGLGLLSIVAGILFRKVSG